MDGDYSKTNEIVFVKGLGDACGFDADHVTVIVSIHVGNLGGAFDPGVPHNDIAVPLVGETECLFGGSENVLILRMGIDAVHFAVDLEGGVFCGDKGVFLQGIDIGVPKPFDMGVGNVGGGEIGVECSRRGNRCIDIQAYLAGSSQMHLKGEGEGMGPDLMCFGSIGESELKVNAMVAIISADQFPWQKTGKTVCGGVGFAKPWPADRNTAAKCFAIRVMRDVTRPEYVRCSGGDPADQLCPLAQNRGRAEGVIDVENVGHGGHFWLETLNFSSA